MMGENRYRTMMEGIQVPEGLREKVLARAGQVSVDSKEGPVCWKRQTREVWRFAVCAALVLIMILGNVMPRSEESMPQGENERIGGALVLTAYAEEPLPAANGNLILGGKGKSVLSHTVLLPEQTQYTNYTFQFRGNHIESLTLTIDRGGLYRVRMGQSLMTVLELPARETYDPDMVYGLWIPPETWVQGQGDTILDGATLHVTAAFTDGSQETQVYRLTKQRLAFCRNEDGSETLVPVLEGGESELFGLYLEPESSVWLRWPVAESNTVSLSAPYGERVVWTPGEADKTWFHSGIDIPGERGVHISAAMAGTVTETGFDADRGNYVILDHGDGLTTLYAQCQELLVERGDSVNAGESIALLGTTGMATGPHLHFEVRQDGKAQNQVAYFDRTIRDTLKMG